LIDLGTHKELISLNSLGSPYAKHSQLIWSPDSKRVAYTEGFPARRLHHRLPTKG
jgi:hypothetical protein